MNFEERDSLEAGRMAGTGAPALPKASRREWIGLAVLALPCLLYSMDLTVLNLAAPQIAAELKPSPSQLLWIMDIYGFMVAGALVTMGTLGDRIGRRKLLLIGAFCFGVASVFAAFATSAAMLIVARAALGLAAATLSPSTLSLIRNMFLDPRERTLAIGVWIASFSVGGAIGPVVGGLMLAKFWWGSVFLANVPIMVLLLVAGPLLLPEFRDPAAGRLDIASALLSVFAVLPAIYGVKLLAEHGISLAAAGAVLLGLAVGWLFVRRQQLLADPLIDLALFDRPGFAMALAINVLGIFVIFGSFFLIAQYMQLVLGMTPLEAGLWSLPTSFAFIAGSLATPRIIRRWRPAQVVTAGFVMVAAGFAVLTQLGGPHSLTLLVIGFVLFSAGFSPIGTLTTDMVIGLAPPEKAGQASGISETSFEFGGALGIALLGSLLTALYGIFMALPVAGIAPEAWAPARQTLGEALIAAQRLPPPEGAAMVEAGRAAFTSALRITSAIAIVIALVMAAIAATRLKRLEPAAGHHH